MIVCSLDALPQVVATRRPSHVISLLDPGTPVRLGAPLSPQRHLCLDVSDINAPMAGYICPDETVMGRILEFGRTWDEAAPLVVHCFAGISRSTAAAFALACERSPEAAEQDIALAMRRAAPHAFPNRLIVALADDMLGRKGRMADAVEAMGGNDLATSGTPFDFPARHR